MHRWCNRFNDRCGFCPGDRLGIDSAFIRQKSTIHNRLQPKKEEGSLLSSAQFLVVFDVVLVAPHSGGYALVYVRVASPLAKLASITMTCWSRDRVALMTYPG